MLRTCEKIQKLYRDGANGAKTPMTPEKLIEQHYGKQKVRLLKVLREGEVHSIRELEVAIMLEGDFESPYTGADNRLVIATDSMKNIVYALAKDYLVGDIEPFGDALGKFFLDRYAQVKLADVQVVESPWNRVAVDGKLHGHTFTRADAMKTFARLRCNRGQTNVESGIQDLVILKSTGSGFEGFHRDDYTTLPETADRVLATRLEARWIFRQTLRNYRPANDSIVASMLRTFAREYSPSVQRTLYQMGKAALEESLEISEIHLSMPNLHCLPVNLRPFGMDNNNEIFVPTEEPHGLIEATVRR
ncbi:MAG TPA: urate oxidase [Acidobacteriota bacterium]|jgi:urate oxidase